MSNDFLWVEKYRPKTISECVLLPELEKTFKSIIKGGELQNMLFTGTAGVGKTTVAKALCNELGLDYILINGSEEGNIDTLRGKIKQFASSISLQGGYKVVILDEADYLNPQSTQPALRGFIEEFANNCRFILTCNFKNRIIEPLHSRCSVYDFSITKKDLPKVCGAFMKRATDILTKENVGFEPKPIADLIMKHAPDLRRILNEMQRLSVNGNIDEHSVSSNKSSSAYGDLFTALKDKDFKKMRSWVVNNQDLDTAAIIRNVYDHIGEYAKPQSIPGVILVLADYQYKDAFVADHELNMVACMTEIMGGTEWL